MSCTGKLWSLISSDLKPENILFVTKAEDSPLKIVDFGTSTLIKPGQRLRRVVGTPYYTAPEVLNCCYNEKCDLWSVGVIAYILTHGSPPFNGGSKKEIVR
jgi:calcium-dependent protein kinase